MEVFIPAISRNIREEEESEVLFFMDGYVFVEHVPGVEYLKLQDTVYFMTVLCQSAIVNGRRQHQYSLLPDQKLKPLRSGIQDMKIAEFKVKDRVKIIKGTWKNLDGYITMVYEGGEKVQVYSEQRSKLSLMDYPVTYLMKIDPE